MRHVTVDAYHGLRRQHRTLTGREAPSIASSTTPIEVVGVLVEGHVSEREIHRYVLRSGFNSQVLLGKLK